MYAPTYTPMVWITKGGQWPSAAAPPFVVDSIGVYIGAYIGVYIGICIAAYAAYAVYAAYAAYAVYGSP